MERTISSGIEKEHNFIANDGTTSKVDYYNKKQKVLVAQNYLFETDWYVIRQADSGKEMPSDIKQKEQKQKHK